MKNNQTIYLSALCLSFILISTKAWSQNPFVLNPVPDILYQYKLNQNNVLEWQTIGQSKDFHCNPLLINRKPLDYDSLALSTKGELEVARRKLPYPKPIFIPFFIQLSRDNYIIRDPGMDFIDKVLYKIDLSIVLAFGKPGDHLIITPVNKEDWKAKRIIKLLNKGC